MSTTADKKGWHEEVRESIGDKKLISNLEAPPRTSDESDNHPKPDNGIERRKCSDLTRS